METYRIGMTTITVRSVDKHGAHLLVHQHGDFMAARDEPPKPFELPNAEKVLIPLIMWRALEKLFALQTDVEGLRDLLLSKVGWPVQSGDERTDLIAQSNAFASKHSEATEATRNALRKLIV
jgi:hypothetical protein